MDSVWRLEQKSGRVLPQPFAWSCCLGRAKRSLPTILVPRRFLLHFWTPLHQQSLQSATIVTHIISNLVLVRCTNGNKSQMQCIGKWVLFISITVILKECYNISHSEIQVFIWKQTNWLDFRSYVIVGYVIDCWNRALYACRYHAVQQTIKKGWLWAAMYYGIGQNGANPIIQSFAQTWWIKKSK